MEREGAMKHYSVKMSDGSRYEFDSTGLDWSVDEKYLLIESGSKRIWLNAMQIVSITISGFNGNDS